MDYLTLLETQTKDGTALTFKWDENVERDENRGFILHKLTAMIGGVEVGYIKVAYIPKKRFEQFYPSIYNYLWQISGWHGPFDSDDRHFPYQSATDEQLFKMNDETSYRRYREPYSKGQTREQMLAWAAAEEDKLWKSHYGTAFKKFKIMQINSPYVGYVEVPGGKWANVDFRRQGIGTALYLEMARRLAERGLRLHGSSLQSPEAEAVWDRFKEKGWVKFDKRRQRFYLSLTGV